MKANQEKRRRFLAILLSFMLLIGQIPARAAAENIPATPTDLEEISPETGAGDGIPAPSGQPETPNGESAPSGETATTETPYEQQETLDGVRITVTADAGVFAPEARLEIRSANRPDFTRAAEEALEIEEGKFIIIRHAVYELTGAEINGIARVRLENLRLTELTDAYPEGELSVTVLRDDDENRTGADRAKKTAAIIRADRNEVVFQITTPGRYDIVAVMRLPETEDAPADEPEETPDSETDGDAEAEPDNGADGETETQPDAEPDGETDNDAENRPENEPADGTEDIPEEETEQGTEPATPTDLPAEENIHEADPKEQESAIRGIQTRPVSRALNAAPEENPEEEPEENGEADGNPEDTPTLRGANDAPDLTTWEGIRQAVANAGTTPTTITLVQRVVTMEANTGPIVVENGQDITIEMGEYRLQRVVISGPAADGRVIHVKAGGKLTLKGESPYGIMSGYTIGNGGAILCEGTLIMDGIGVVSGKATGYGGGIYVAPGGDVTISGRCDISQNRASNGSGIYVAAGGTLTLGSGTHVYRNDLIDDEIDYTAGIDLYGTLNISGSAKVDVANANYRNIVYLHEDSRINVTGPLSSDAEIWFGSDQRATTETPAVLPFYLYQKSDLDKLFYYANYQEDYGYELGLNADNQVVVGSRIDLRFTAEPTGAVTGSMPMDTIISGTVYELPENGFTYSGGDFTGWKVSGRTELLQPGEEAVLTGSGTQTITAMYSVKYRDGEKDETRNYDGYTRITETTAALNSNTTGGWYVASGNTTVINRIEVAKNQEVNLILCDGAQLQAAKGIHVPNGSRLYIWGQAGGNGTLLISGTAQSNAGIGGNSGENQTPSGRVTINGGKVTVTGGTGAAAIGGASGQAGGRVDINGGTVTATAGSGAAAIGGGQGKAGGTTEIHGGTVTATGSGSGAGIGGGAAGDSGAIRIYAGTVTATGGENGGAGIGSGSFSSKTKSGGEIEIHDGTVTATARKQSAGIGGGSKSDGGKITIAGGVINATGNGGKGIGPGEGADETGNIYLKWTDATKGTMRLQANSYGGTVHVVKYFVIEGDSDPLYTTDNADKNKIAGKILLPFNDEITSWSILQLKINESPNNDRDPEILRLADNITAGSNEKMLEIPTGKNIILDLNGFTLDRGLQNNGSYDGSVIHVQENATLTIRDTSDGRSGIITGGYDAGLGGGIRTDGKLILESGSISNNTSGETGGGIHVSKTGSLEMYGGTVENNYTRFEGGGIAIRGGSAKITGGVIRNNSIRPGSSAGGGIMCDYYSTMEISGCEICNNTAEYGAAICLYGSTRVSFGSGLNIHDNHPPAASESACDLYIEYAEISIDGSLQSLQPLSVGGTLHTNLAVKPHIISEVLENPDDIQYFYPNRDILAIALNSEGRMVWGYKKTVTITSEGGTGSMDSVTVVQGSDYILPVSGFTPPEGLNFAGWRVNDGTQLLPEGEIIPVSDDITLTACFGMPYEDENGTVCSAYQYSFINGNTTELQDGWYVADNSLEIDERIRIKGSVFLILRDDATLTLPEGISVNEGNSLTIYAQSTGEHCGKIISYGTRDGDLDGQIGGDNEHNAGTVTISGGVIDVQKKRMGAAIGGGNRGLAGTVTIHRGTVNAVGGPKSAGIGSAQASDGGTITITGGTVTARGGENGAGIGGGWTGNGGTITITGGTVTAYGTMGGAGIGGGMGNGASGAGLAGTILISGGRIHAYGDDGAKGIGDGQNAQTSSPKSIQLTWTDQTMDSMQVYANHYDRSMKLVRPFLTDDGEVYVPGREWDYSSFDRWDGKTLTPTRAIYDWQTLQEEIDRAEDGAVLNVMSNLTATDDDTAILVPADKNITIDLQGFSLDRDLAKKDPRPDGNVIINHGTLTIVNTSNSVGWITRGNVDGNGGGIWNDGTLTIRGNISILYNYAATTTGNTSQGGGIYNNGGTVLLDGININFNTAQWQGGGIYTYGGSMTLQNTYVVSNSVSDLSTNDTTGISTSSGGGIYAAGVKESKGHVIIDQSYIWTNSSSKNGGGISGTGTIIEIRNNSEIKNNKANDSGGGILATSSVQLTVSNSSIKNNKAVKGGAVYTSNQATITLQSSQITDNYTTGENGFGGIYEADPYVRLALAGSTVIQNNQGSQNQANNLYVAAENPIEIDANSLNEDAWIGITTQEQPTSTRPVEFTTQLIPPEDKSRFFSDDEEYAVDVRKDGGAVLGLAAEITYVIGQNVGTRDNEKGAIGNDFILPVYNTDYDGIAGIRLVGWQVNEDPVWKTTGSSIRLTGDITLTAIFSVPYIAEDGTTQYMNCRILNDDLNDWFAGENYGYAAIGKVNADYANTAADTNLILCDGCNLTVEEGIGVETTSDLSIWGQNSQNGRLTTYGQAGDAGIGGRLIGMISGVSGDAGAITIAGGIITAYGGDAAAGIGGGRDGSGGTIRIVRGTVTAVGGKDAAGIGGGKQGNGPVITIEGGIVTAVSGIDGAGIGGGLKGSGGTITINNGNVNAWTDNGSRSAAIGSGSQGRTSGTITINGGTVSALCKGQYGAAIGAGYGSQLESVTITGGLVGATNGRYSACIGGSSKYDGTVTISGGMVSASMNRFGEAGIRAGRIVLTWTEESKSSTRVYSPSYQAEQVILERPFRPDEDEFAIIMPGIADEQTRKTRMESLTIIPCDRIPVYSWKTLAQAVAACSGGQVTLKLEADIEAESDDTRILIDGEKDIILDLNGHTMDRNAPSARNNGHVITVEKDAKLTIRDSRGAGVIRGGKSNANGGGIVVNGTLILEGGTIRENTTTNDGGAISLQTSGARLVMSGGTITGNTAALSAGAIRLYSGTTATISGGTISGNTATGYHGGAIYNNGTLTVSGGVITGNTAGMQGGAILEAGTLNIEGEPMIIGNTVNGGEHNVYLRPGKTLHPTGELSGSAIIGVTAERTPPVTLTSGLSSHGKPENFSSDNIQYIISLNADREAVLGTGAVITFDGNGGTGSMQPVTVALNSRYPLPDCGFITPGGASFLGWTIQGTEGDPIPAGTAIDIPGNITLTAQYGSADYDVWVGGVRINDDNKGDVLGNGTVQYDPDTGILTLTGAELSSQETADASSNTGIYAEGDLTIRGSGTIQASICGIQTTGNLTIEREASLRITVTQETKRTMAGIHSGGDLTITNSTITTTGGYYGLNSDAGLTIVNSNVDATSRSIAVNSTGNMALRGETTKLHALRTSTNPTPAVMSAQDVEITAPLSILLPEGGSVYWGTIVKADQTNAGEVLILDYVPLNGVSLPETVYLKTGETFQMTPVFDPANASDQGVSWKSSNTGIATVDENGLVRAVKENDKPAIITVTTDSGGKTATSQVYVSKAIPTYAITYAETANGTISGPDSSQKDQMITLTATPDEGYELTDLYYQSSTGQKTNISTETCQFKMPGKKITIHAVFRQISCVYTVRYDANGGIGEMSDQEFEYGVGQALSRNTFTKAWSVFTGWKDDQGREYNDGQVVRNLTTLDGSVIILHAQWSSPEYSITLDLAEETERHGTVSLNRERAQYGNGIIVQAIPEDGYCTSEATYQHSGSGAENMPGENNVYRFNMPASDVTIRIRFEKNTYYVTFNPGHTDDITGSMEDQEIPYGKATQLTKNAYTRTGYSFTGWHFVRADGTEETYADEAEVLNLTNQPGSRVTLNAQWAIDQHTISFETNGGTPETIEPITLDYGSLITPPEDPEKTGYTFTGWNPTIPQRMPAEDLTLEAQWQINQYTLTFDSMGGSPVDPITQDYNTRVTPPDDPTRQGYDFLGWDADIPETMPAKNMTFRARWEKQQAEYHTIFFDTAGGSSIAPITQEAGSAVTQPEDPTKEGYDFDGWDPAVPETMPSEDITVHARWKIKTFTITFDTDGGEPRITPVTQNYNTAIDPPADPTKTGYRFDGWDPAIPVRMPAGDMTVKAQWTIRQYTLRFDTDGGSGIDPITQDYDSTITAPENPTKTGYTFDTWIPEIPERMPAEDTTVKAAWTKTPYSITVQPSDESGTLTLYPATGPYYYGDTVTVYATPGNGYALKSLTYQAEAGEPVTPAMDGTGAYSFSMPAADVEVEAVFEEIRVTGVQVEPAAIDMLTGETTRINALVKPENALNRTVTWTSSDPGTATVGTDGTVTAEGAGECTITATTSDGGYQATCTITVTDPIPQAYGITVSEAEHGRVTAEKTEETAGATVILTIMPDTGYRLDTLTCRTEEGTEVDIAEDEGQYVFVMPAANVEISAAFAANQYTLTFDTDGGSDIAPIKQAYGTAITAPANPTKTGYTFIGWNDAIPATMPAKDMTFTARWTINSYTLTFDTDGGNTIAAMTQAYDTEISAPADPTKTGYTFSGWNPAIPEKMPAEDTTVKAQWTVNEYTLTFDTDGGSETAAMTQAYGTAVTAPANPAKTGHTFSGWNPAIPETMPAENLTVRAVWSRNEYTITVSESVGNGSITLYPASGPYYYGDSVTVYATAAEKHQLKAGTLKYTEAGSDTATKITTDTSGAYTFSMPAANITISAEFEPIPVTGVQLDHSAVTLTPNDTMTLHATVLPEDAYHRDVDWESSNPSIATVDENGTVTAIAPGECTITAKVRGDETITAQCAVTVNVPSPTLYKVTVNPASNGRVTTSRSRTTADTAVYLTVIADEGYSLDTLTCTTEGETGATVPTTEQADGRYMFIMPEGNVTVNATFKADSYTLIFDATGGAWADGSTTKETSQAYNDAVTAPAEPTRTGYTFIGWDKAVPATMPAEDMTITARWTINRYTITFDTAGGSAISAITQEYGTAVTAPADPARTGYTFNGWDGTIPATMPAENITLTAQWTANRYTITFDTDGGSTVNPITQDYGTTVTAPEDPTKTGNTFEGWDPAIPETMPAEDLTVRAKWSRNKYTITVDEPIEHGSITLYPASETYHYGDSVTVYATPDDRYALTILTYRTGDNEPVDITRDETGTYTFSMPAANAVIQAAFEKIPVTGVTLDQSEAVVVTYQTLTLYATVLPADAYNQDVTWESTDESVATVDENGTVTGVRFGDCTIIVRTADGEQTAECAITVNVPPAPKLYWVRIATPENGQVTTNRSRTNAGASVTLTATPDEGYRLEKLTGLIAGGENTVSLTEKGSGQYVFIMPEGRVDVTAEFTANEYTLTFDTAGGSEIAPITQAYGSAIDPPENPTKEGYTFIGWSSAFPQTMPAKDMTLTARWEINRYTLTFDTDGGSAIVPITQEYNTAVNPPVNPTKEGYTFTGWQPEIPETMPAQDRTFKALWQVNQYTITFRSAGGLYGTITQAFGTAVVPPDDPEYAGFEFAGWVPEVPAVMPAENITVRAQWIPVDYTITSYCDLAQGTVNASVQEARMGDEITVTVLPYAGYTLASLTVRTNNGTIIPEQKAGSTEQYLFTMPASDVTIHAVFEPDGSIETVYHISVSPEITNGTVTPDRTEAPENEDVHLSVSPETGYGLNSIQYRYEKDSVATQTDLAPDADGGYSFRMPAADVTVSAEFTRQSYRITIASMQNGTVTTEKETAEYGDDVQLTVQPATGYQLSVLSWQAKNAAPTNLKTEPYSFTMPAADVTVRAEFTAKRVTGVSLDRNEADMTEGGTLELTATPEPDDALNPNVTWTSSDPSVATVNDGTVTAIGEGTAVITVTTEDGAFKAQCRVTVKPETVTITFMPGDGGTGNMEPVQVRKGETEYILPDSEFSAAAEGITFAGWMWTADETTQYGAPGTRITVTGEMTLTAVWGYPITVTETEHGTIDAPIGSSASTGGTDNVTITVKPDRGYKLKSITVKDQAGAETTPNRISDEAYSFSMPASPVTVTAEFEPITYQVEFIHNLPDYDGPDMENQIFTYDQFDRLSPNEYHSDGMNFSVWVDDSTGTQYSDGQRVRNLTDQDGATITLRAGWNQASYTIYFNSVHGTVADYSGMNYEYYNSIVTLTVSPDPGYSLDSLSWVRTGTRDIAEPIDEQDGEGNYTFRMPASSVTVNGVFAPNTYTVRFDANAEDAEGETEDQAFIYDEEQELTPNAFIREGYRFDGWSTQTGKDPENPGTHYGDQETVKNLTEEAEGTVILYAQWIPIYYSVSVTNAEDADGVIRGKAKASPVMASKGTTVRLTFEMTDGYKPGLVVLVPDNGSMFQALTPDADGAYSFSMPAANVTVMTAYTGISYTVSYDANGGSGTMEDQAFTYGQAQKLTENAFTRSGYHFLRWNASADGTGMPYFDQQPVRNLTTKDGSTVMLYALWEPNPYTIKFDTDGGTEIPAITQDYDTAITAPADPTRTGYTFTGWEPAIPAKMPAGDMTVQAQWKINQYTMIIMDGDTELSRITADYGAKITPPDAPEKEGYTFDGWDPEIPETMPAEGLTIRAVWKKASPPSPEEDNQAQKPVLRSRGTTSITIYTRPGEEYSIDGGKTWQDSGEFKGLKANTLYHITARTKGTDTTEAGKPSEALAARTLSDAGGSAAKHSVQVAVLTGGLTLRTARPENGEANGRPVLADAERIREIRNSFGKDRVLLIGSFNPETIPMPEEETAPDPTSNLAELIREAAYDAVIPAGRVPGDELTALCISLAEQDIPVLAANIYYDGSDGSHEAGENVFTPYTVRTVYVDGNPHRIGILALWNGDMPEGTGFLRAHPENTEGTPAAEAALYLPMMREEKCEFIIVCFFGDTDAAEGTTEEDGERPLSPAEQLVRNNTGIDLLILPEAADDSEPDDGLTDMNGHQVPVLRETDGFTECVCLFSENADGKLLYTLNEGKTE